jgi:hypothetical protein
MRKTPAARDPTRNLWLQLGFPDAEEHFLKAELVLRLDKAIMSLGLTQPAAARRIGATQPELSKITVLTRWPMNISLSINPVVVRIVVPEG